MRIFRILYRAEMTVSQAVEIMSWLDGQSVIYDCYMDGRGWMSETMLDRIELYASNPNLVGYLRSVRTPVTDLKAFLIERGSSIQKIHVFCRDQETQRDILRHLPFAHVKVSSSAERNVEINDEAADKGIALIALADHLGIGRDQVMAFGDGLNDIPMIRAAGIGVVMGNASDEVKAAADMIAADNDRDGVAEVIEALIAAGR